MALIVTICSSHAASAQSSVDERTVRSAAGIVASDHPLASEVGAQLLADGGHAVDAAVGTLLALGVVNPFASGLGGGGFCLVRPVDGEVSVLDFRERAPGGAHRDMYVRDGEVQGELTMRGGLAVAVPSEAAGLEALHQKFGELPWQNVVRPARALAVDGFEVGELLPRRLASAAEKLEQSPLLAAAFKRDGAWVQTGSRLKRPELGELLRRIERDGARAFHEGEVAEAIVAAVNAAGGVFTLEDLAAYQVTWREALRGTYRGYEIYTMPPPSSGGTTILAALNILERYDLATLGYNPESVHRITEALKYAFADRAAWLGDADFVSVPVTELVSKDVAGARRILPAATQDTTAYGKAAQLPTDGGTSHVSVVDADGAMVACTSTINTSFGSMVYVPQFGLVMNNEMGDFSAQPGVPNNYGLVGSEQNAVAPGKRPLSSMSPTLVLRDGQPYMAVGASGGPTIITGTLLAMVGVIDFGRTPWESIAAPRLHHQWMPDILFAEEMAQSWLDVLMRRGHQVQVRNAYNAVQMVVRMDDGMWVGVSDPRKFGRPAAAPVKQ